MSNGLDSLDAMRRRKGGREMPPPRNAPRASPVAVSKPAPELTTTVSEPADAPGTAEQPAAATEAEALTKVTVYVDSAADEFLESVRMAGRLAKPKIDASRSAVVRFALAELAQRMSPEQIAQHLHNQAAPYSGTGRRRL